MSSSSSSPGPSTADASSRLDSWLVSKGGLRLDVAARVYAFMVGEFDAQIVGDLKHLSKVDMELVISQNGLKKVPAARLLEAMGYSQAPAGTPLKPSNDTDAAEDADGGDGEGGADGRGSSSSSSIIVASSSACQIPLPGRRVLPPALCNKPRARILLLSFFTTTTKARLWKEEDGNDNTLGLKNRMCYAAARGYRYVIEVVDNSKITKTPIMFYKTYLVSQYLQFTDWLVWMDYDLIVKNPHNW